MQLQFSKTFDSQNRFRSNPRYLLVEIANFAQWQLPFIIFSVVEIFVIALNVIFFFYLSQIKTRLPRQFIRYLMYYGLTTQWFSTTTHKREDFEGWPSKGLENNVFWSIRAPRQLVLALLLLWAPPDYKVRVHAERFKWWIVPQTRPCKTKPTCCTCTVVRVYKPVNYCFYQNTNGTAMQKAVHLPRGFFKLDEFPLLYVFTCAKTNHYTCTILWAVARVNFYIYTLLTRGYMRIPMRY